MESDHPKSLAATDCLYLVRRGSREDRRIKAYEAAARLSTPIIEAQAQLIVNTNQLYTDQVAICGYLEERVRFLEQQNQRLKAENLVLSSELSRLRPAPKSSPGLGSPFLRHNVPRKNSGK